MANKKLSKNEKAITLNVNANLQPVWIDNMNINIRDDDICLLRMFSILPEGHFEQFRMMTNKKRLVEFADTLCSILNYYPIKPKQKKK